MFESGGFYNKKKLKPVFFKNNFCGFHGLRGSANPVLTATGLVNGTWRFSTPCKIDAPIVKKLSDDYVGDSYSCATVGAHPLLGISGRMGEI